MLRNISKKYITSSIKKACSSNRTELYKKGPVYSNSEDVICCGCGACANVCPTNAIEIKLDNNGFYQFHLDSKKCIKCGKCQNICPIKNFPKDSFNDNTPTFSVKSNNINTLETSTSGGASYEISKLLNEQGYYVVGCTYDYTTESAKHIIIPPNSPNKLNLIQGSKYIQSDFSYILDDIIKLPKAVIFGTPCQIAAIHNILEYKKLKKDFIFVELICHGVPSQNLWNKYIKETKKRLKISNNDYLVNFRSKKNYWFNQTIGLYTKNKKINIPYSKDTFAQLFLADICLMKSCYNCPYRVKSFADIKIGDYWGKKFKNDKTGVSIILNFSKKGEKILNDLKAKEIINITSQSYSDYIVRQIINSINPPVFYYHLLKDLKNKNLSLIKIKKKYLKYSNLENLINNLINNFKK